jgi:hypothetical protein
VIGQPASNSDERADATLFTVDRAGNLIGTLGLHGRELSANESPFMPGYVRWLRIPGSRDRLLLESMNGKSDGPHWDCWSLDLKSGNMKRVCYGLLAGTSPTGKRILAADHPWVGPYKRGGRRCGPLQLVDLGTGQKRNLTGKLISILGGDWRYQPYMRAVDERLLGDCIAYYRGLQIHEDRDSRKDPEHEHFLAARKTLSQISTARIRERLIPIRNAQAPRSIAYIAASFVLALRGIDVTGNTRRITNSYRPPEAKVHERDVEHYAPWMGDVFMAFNEVYKKYPSDQILEMVLRTHSDAEDWCDEQATLFHRYPVEVMRVSDKIDHMGELGTEILPRYAGIYSQNTKRSDYRRVRAVLNRVCASTDPATATRARRCRRMFQTALKSPEYKQ